MSDRTSYRDEHEAYLHPSRDELDVLTVLRALGDPTRLEIVRLLAHEPSGEIACGAFGLDATKQNLSHHFRVLRESGVIFTRDEGRNRFTSLREGDFEHRFPGLLSAVVNGASVKVR